MKKYCIDTSGLSNPLEQMPEDIHISLWERIRLLVTSGMMAVTAEIYDELCHLPGKIGDCIKDHERDLLMEVEAGAWDWPTYLEHVSRMQLAYEPYISEYNRHRSGTVGLNDLTIVALAKTLGLPVVSMEIRVADLRSSQKRKIPNICDLEGVRHMTFTEFLRDEGIRL